MKKEAERSSRPLLGDGLGLGLDCKLPIDVLQSLAMRAESKGFAALWAIHYHYYRDPFVVLGAVASKTTKILLGTAVTNTFEKHPVSVAMSAVTVREQSGRPTILGLGRGVEHILKEQMGIDYTDSFQELEESVAIIKEFFSGKIVNFRGKIFTVNDVSMGIAPRGTDISSNDEIPIFLAGMGSRALNLAARVADGVILNYCTTPSYIAHAVAACLARPRSPCNMQNERSLTCFHFRVLEIRSFRSWMKT